ncbi:N-acetylmuramoyl-L-alanine amidase [Cytobacillus sp. S13-E01]|uniref:N-acetylmuramoyl-L-alanine amidase n=1 Tax=Cytobacillus sp. S13-E01 TaxID=3031326 RepID=UPI0023D87C12|nr:N-acetylmuramoyl-L-alanine amidase [Cytobacillus sp. S13-E01]MDF0726040.1 N-acetylmuramoyl-L-alanine amidase [Cytobacillus sp. S13-E01]
MKSSCYVILLTIIFLSFSSGISIAEETIEQGDEVVQEKQVQPESESEETVIDEITSVDKGSQETVSVPSFIDLPANHRVYTEVTYLASGKIVSGSNGYFLPDRFVTRAEAAAMFGRSLSFDGTKRATSFPDVGMSNFASGYISSATADKIINGYPDGKFKPNNIVTRGEMALLISRAFGYDAKTTQAAVKVLMSKGIAEGMKDGSFGEKAPMKRSDFSVFLARSINPKFTLNYKASAMKEATVKVSEINVRTGPLLTYPVIGKLPKDVEVEILYEFGDWLLIRGLDIEGFVHKDLLIVENSETTLESFLRSQTIVIDAGHGGNDPGSIGGKLYESTVTLDVALKVKDYFLQTPFNIKLTREDNSRLELFERVALAKRWNGNVFVSIHTNAFNTKANGTETFYYSAAATNPYVQQSKLLAEYVQKRLIEAWDLYDRGVKKGNLHVLRENEMPAALVELAFIDNVEDKKKLESDQWRQEAAKAIYWGILDYYKANGTDVNSLYNVGK